MSRAARPASTATAITTPPHMSTKATAAPTFSGAPAGRFGQSDRRLIATRNVPEYTATRGAKASDAAMAGPAIAAGPVAGPSASGARRRFRTRTTSATTHSNPTATAA